MREEGREGVAEGLWSSSDSREGGVGVFNCNSSCIIAVLYILITKYYVLHMVLHVFLRNAHNVFCSALCVREEPLTITPILKSYF